MNKILFSILPAPDAPPMNLAPMPILHPTMATPLVVLVRGADREMVFATCLNGNR